MTAPLPPQALQTCTSPSNSAARGRPRLPIIGRLREPTTSWCTLLPLFTVPNAAGVGARRSKRLGPSRRQAALITEPLHAPPDRRGFLFARGRMPRGAVPSCSSVLEPGSGELTRRFTRRFCCRCWQRGPALALCCCGAHHSQALCLVQSVADSSSTCCTRTRATTGNDHCGKNPRQLTRDREDAA
jgi:hypothetical protein